MICTSITLSIFKAVWMVVRSGIQIALHRVWEFRILEEHSDRRGKLAEVNVFISGRCLNRDPWSLSLIAHDVKCLMHAPFTVAISDF